MYINYLLHVNKQVYVLGSNLEVGTILCLCVSDRQTDRHTAILFVFLAKGPKSTVTVLQIVCTGRMLGSVIFNSIRLLTIYINLLALYLKI